MHQMAVFILGLFLAITVRASRVNLYDQVIMSCLDYGHQTPSKEQLSECHNIARKQVLSSLERYNDYLDCIDYGHQKVSAEKEISCLRIISTSDLN